MTTGMNPSWVLSDEQRKKRFKKYRDGQGPDGEGNELSPASSQVCDYLPLLILTSFYLNASSPSSSSPSSSSPSSSSPSSSFPSPRTRSGTLPWAWAWTVASLSTWSWARRGGAPSLLPCRWPRWGCRPSRGSSPSLDPALLRGIHQVHQSFYLPHKPPTHPPAPISPQTPPPGTPPACPGSPAPPPYPWACPSP